MTRIGIVDAMDIPIKRLHDHVTLPSYQSSGAAAMDIHAAIDKDVVIEPMERMIVPAGFSLEIPTGYEVQLRARSGMSLKYGICLANGVGTIDSDYRGEVGVILINLSDQTFTVTPDMRIAQMVLVRHEVIEWQQVDELSTTERGSGGYGSTRH